MIKDLSDHPDLPYRMKIEDYNPPSHALFDALIELAAQSNGRLKVQTSNQRNRTVWLSGTISCSKLAELLKHTLVEI